MTKKHLCPLCATNADFFEEISTSYYFKCPNCFGIFMSKINLPTKEDEIERYESHNNDVNDKGYQNFVSDIVDAVKDDFDKNTIGLDYGAGTGPVISKMLSDFNYKIYQYDPFFHPYKSKLELNYDYIVSCEVIEHFFNPYSEFIKLKSMLKPGGKLYCKTELYKPSIDFQKWYYIFDPTHVFLYSEETFNWIKENIGFSKLEIRNRLSIFSL